MAKSFKVEIVTPEGTAYAAECSALTVPAWEGYLGVLAGHAPLLTVLKAGVLSVRDAQDRARHFALKGGFMEVSKSRAMVLADAIEAAEDVDVSAAEKALDAAIAAAEAARGVADAPEKRAARAAQKEDREEARAWAEARLSAADKTRG